ncbi:hypothetical protein, partial [Escherichia coli]|uniref:hypothetical protein n=1 Tax=Escherichia coli TaxID=562 RepID=UPI003EDEFACE
DLGSVARIRVYGKYFSYRMLNIHKRKKCLSDALKQPFQKESAFFWFGLVFSCLFAFFAPESD